MSNAGRIALTRVAHRARIGRSGGRHAAPQQGTEADRASFIRSLYGDGALDTVDVIERMYEDFGFTVTEAEVCRAIRRLGEVVEPSHRWRPH